MAKFQLFTLLPKKVQLAFYFRPLNYIKLLVLVLKNVSYRQTKKKKIIVKPIDPRSTQKQKM